MMEKARLSPERAALTSPNDIFNFAKDWAHANVNEQNVPKKYFDAKANAKQRDQQVKNWFEGYVTDRLRRGAKAFEFAEMDRLLATRGIANRDFPTAQALDDALAEHKFDQALREAILGQLPKERKVCKDCILCLDASDGRELWRKEYPGHDHCWGISSTPLVADGKVYLVGSTSKACCFKLSDGELVWEHQLLTPPGRLRVDSSFLLIDGMVVVLADRLTALDAATGEEKWKHPTIDCNENSPVVWTCQGKQYIIINRAGGKVSCVEPKSGKLVWEAPGGGCSTCAIDGDTMALVTDPGRGGLIAYRLTPDGAEKLWAVPEAGDRGASAIIHDGHVYAVTNGTAFCVEVATGRVKWKGPVGGGEISSPILADGKIFVPVGAGRALAMLRASPEKFEMLANVPVPVATCSSPAFADGKLFVRLGEADPKVPARNCLACYDLTKEPTGKTENP